MKWIKWFGSLSFTFLILIFIILLVATGTFIESFSSHEKASIHVYQSWPFIGVLGCIFINIFTSSLLRYPYQLKNIPFLITHIGLLLIITGTILKITHGKQGHIRLQEGEKINRWYDNTGKDLWLWKFGDFTLSNPLINPINPSLYLKLDDHSQLKYKNIENRACTYKAWFNGSSCQFNKLNIPTITLEEKTPSFNLKKHFYYDKNLDSFIGASLTSLSDELLCQTIHSHYKLVKISPLTEEKQVLSNSLWRINSTGKKLISQLHIESDNSTLLFDHTKGPLYFHSDTKQDSSLLHLEGPSIILLIDTPLEEKLVHIDKFAHITIKTFSNKKMDNLYTYNFGFDGMFTEFDLTNPCDELPYKIFQDNLQNLIQSAISILDNNKIFSILHTYCKEYNIPIHDLLSNIILKSNNIGTNPFNTSPWPMHLKIATKKFPQKLIQGIYASYPIISYYKQFTSLETLKEELLKSPLKEFIPIDIHSKNDLIQTIIPPLVESASSIKSNHEIPMLEFYSILFSYIGFPIHQALDEVLLNSNSSIKNTYSLNKIQSPLILATNKSKNTDTTLFHFQQNNKIYSIPFSNKQSFFGTPLANGNYLAKVETRSNTFPFHIYISKAFTSYLPNTNQPSNYFCHGSYQINNKQISFILSSNQVYETPEGWRLYLSAIDEPDNEPTSVQITVNYDPFRYKITYPGLILVSLGIIGLFLGIKENKGNKK